MTATAYTGTDLYLKFGTTEIQSYFRAFDPVQSVDLVEKSTGNDRYKTYLPTLKDGTASCNMILGTEFDFRTALKVGTEATLEWGDRGTITGRPRNRVLAIVNNHAPTYPYTDLVALSVSWQLSGSITEDTY